MLEGTFIGPLKIIGGPQLGIYVLFISSQLNRALSLNRWRGCKIWKELLPIPIHFTYAPDFSNEGK
jgi:hypothetical protein